MSHYAFGFLSVPQPPPKPRKTGVTCVTDVSWTTPALDDFLDDFGDLVDWVKIVNHRRVASHYDDDWYRRRIAMLAKHQVGTYIGGMTFELAYVQGHYREFFEKSLRLGFKAVEVSEDSLPDMPPSERRCIIGEARDMGLRVFTEIGKKAPVEPLKVEDAVAAIREDLEAGSEHVVVEAAETRLLRERGQVEILPEIARAVGLEHVFFELRRGYKTPQPWMELCAWLIETLGPEVNIMNINVDEAVDVDNMRRPLSTFLLEEHAKVK